jgi:hypothetical protein
MDIDLLVFDLGFYCRLIYPNLEIVAKVKESADGPISKPLKFCPFRN